MAVTIKDVAREAGVAVMTASKAMRGHSSVRKHLQERVAAASAKLNYRPNQVARGLRNRQSTLVSVAVIELWNPYFGSLAGALIQRLYAAEKEPVLALHADQIIALQHAYASCGAILAYGFASSHVNELAVRQPVVTIGAMDPEDQEAPDVSFDFAYAYSTLARRIVKDGRRRVAFCSEAHVVETNVKSKFRHAQAVLEAAGISPAMASPAGAVSTQAVIQHLQDNPGSLDTVFCQNDLQAAIVAGAVLQLGLRAPEDLLIIGCDATVPMPGVWTVRCDVAALADAVVTQLLRMINGNAAVAHRTVLRPELVIPSTETPEPTAD